MATDPRRVMLRGGLGERVAVAGRCGCRPDEAWATRSVYAVLVRTMTDRASQSAVPAALSGSNATIQQRSGRSAAERWNRSYRVHDRGVVNEPKPDRVGP